MNNLTSFPEILILIAGVLAVLGTVGVLLVRRWPRDSRPGRKDESTGTTTADAGEERPPAVPPAGPVVDVPLPTDPTLDEPVIHVPEDALEAEVAAPEVEAPEPVVGRFQRLKARLARSGSPLGAKLLAVLSRDSLSEDDWDEIEELLLLADVGAGPATDLVEELRTEVRVRGLQDAGAVRALLREKLIALVDPTLDRSLDLTRPKDDDGNELPAAVLVVGVNGAGKTTTVGKLTRVLVAEGKTVLLGAADTFRAAAAEQLTTWGNRVGVETVRSDREGADPASVAFDAVRKAADDGVDVVLVDTAGRLQNKAGLMDELGKVSRVIGKVTPLSEVLLVLDATTGQNGLNQARVFTEVAGVTGIVLTKLDGTAKGGIVVAVQRELGLPVKLVGLGEGADDLAPFDPEQFVDGLLGD